MKQLSDEELVGRHLQARDSADGRKALDELFGRYHGRVALWCYRIAGDRETAADLAQEIFLKAYKNIESYRGGAKFSTWLYSISRNHCFNEMQSRSRRFNAASDELPDDLAAVGEDAHALVEREQSRRMLHQLLAENLTDTERHVMTLHYGEDVPLETISRLLELRNASGAKAYLVSAKRKLGRVVERWRARERSAG